MGQAPVGTFPGRPEQGVGGRETRTGSEKDRIDTREGAMGSGQREGAEGAEAGQLGRTGLGRGGDR
ncbi:MAG: hypothetical protein EA421_06240 [Gemmatimonadales bacterium]|nr:MAG: hypothetical protein EA421_06240 [Gemmatimonadales bacterium]